MSSSHEHAIARLLNEQTEDLCSASLTQMLICLVSPR